MQSRLRHRPAWPLAVLVLAGCAESSTEPIPQAEACESVTPLSLGVGESVQLSGSSARSVCVGASSIGEEFVLVASALHATGTTQIQLEAKNVGTITGPPSPAPPALAAPSTAASIPAGAPLPSSRFHTTLRERERTQLTFANAPAAAGGFAPAAAAVRVPEVGETMSFNAQTEEACEDPLLVTARVEAVSDRAVVLSDVDNPTGGFLPTDYEFFADQIDQLVAPIVESAFGVPSDLDQNGRTIILFTKEVNAIESDEDGAFTSGFFFSRDLFPTTASPPLSACETSNEGEILYMMVPDPLGTHGEAFTRDEVERFTLTNIGHELQHLVNASQRLFGVNGATSFEDTWLNEAMSHMVEELLFYAAAGLGPGLDIGIDDLTQESVGAINRYQLFNFLRLRLFFDEPTTNSPFADDDLLATRGSAWAFLRYASDRLGIGDDSFLRDLVTSPLTGLDNLGAALGGSAVVFDWLGDWSVGLYADNRVSGVPTRFQDVSWDNPSLFLATSLDPPYIATTNLGFTPSVAQSITAGGSSFFRFGVARDDVASIEIDSGGGVPPATLRVTVLRTR